MKRTLFLLALLTASTLSSYATPPNILFLVADDQHRDQYNYLPEGRDESGASRNLTPNIDRLTGEGIIFDAQYCSTSVCTPSRFTTLTGRYACRAKGIKTKDDQIMISWNTRIHAGETTIASLLQKAGYFTGGVGKNHTIKAEEPHHIAKKADPRDPETARHLKENHDASIAAYQGCGFDYAASIYQHNIPGLACRELEAHNLDWITKGALDFFDLAKKEQRPFFLYAAYTLPHGPNHNNAYKGNPLATPAGFLEKPLEVQPARSTLLPRLKKAGLDTDRADMLWLDDSIGAMLTRLSDLGLLENTIIFYFNDHGVEAGKGSLYQGGVLTQSWAWNPNTIPGNRRVNHLVNNVDFAPTLLELAGARPESMDGKSFAKILKGGDTPVNDSLYFEIGAARAVIKGRYKYIAFRTPPSLEKMSLEDRKAAHQKYWQGNQDRRDRTNKKEIPVDDPEFRWTHIADVPGGRGSESPALKHYAKNYYDKDQLYDLQADPDERHNLAADPEHAKTLADLREELTKHLSKLPGKFGEFE